MYPGQHARRSVNISSPKQRALSASCRSAISSKTGEPHDGRAPDYDDWALERRHPGLLSCSGHRPGAVLYGYPRGQRGPAVPAGKSRLHREERAELPFQKAILERSSCLTPSAAVSVSPVSVCSSCARRTSEKYSAPSGQRKSAKKRKPTESSCCKQ